jgi:hypothetical protein
MLPRTHFEKAHLHHSLSTSGILSQKFESVNPRTLRLKSQEKSPLFPANSDPLPFSVFCRPTPPELTNRTSAELTNPRPSDGSWNEIIDNPSFFSPSLELSDPCTYTDMSRPFFKSTVARRLSQQHGRLFSTTRCALRLSASSSVGQPATRRLTTATVGAPAYRPSLRGCLSRSPVRQSVASFSSSCARLATKVTQNPRTGDDGEPLMISISPRAIAVRVQ